MFKTIIFLGALSVGVLAAAASAAIAQPDSAAVVVSYVDLDTRTDAGAAKLLARLRSAASQVCEGHRQGMLGVGVTTRFRACRDTTLSHSVETIGSSRLTALYSGRTETRLAQSSSSH